MRSHTDDEIHAISGSVIKNEIDAAVEYYALYNPDIPIIPQRLEEVKAVVAGAIIAYQTSIEYNELGHRIAMETSWPRWHAGRLGEEATSFAGRVIRDYLKAFPNISLVEDTKSKENKS